MNNYKFMHSGAGVRSREGYYIGASEIPIILGLTKTTPMELWEQKTGRRIDCVKKDKSLYEVTG